jgi:hypothetical protein
VRSSADGVEFGAESVFVEAAGVPCVIRDVRNRLVAVFQWFPQDDQTHFDRVAVRFSEDAGKTWSKPVPISVDGLPDGYQRPFDPTIVELPDGRFRLYFSCGPQQVPGNRMRAATYSAISDNGIDYRFEPGARFEAEGQSVVDCAVARIGGKWHYLAPGPPPGGTAYHAVSDDGLTFTRLPDIGFGGGTSSIGNLLAWGSGMRFYGSSREGAWWSYSADGSTWTAPVYTGIRGGDPALVEVSPGSLLLVYTGQSRAGRSRPAIAGRATEPVQPRQPQSMPPRQPGAGPDGGPYFHKVCSATSPDGINWTRDPGFRIDHASVPCAVNDGDRRVLLYYVDADRGPGLQESTGCAESTDGLNFCKLPFAIDGMPMRKALDPCVVADPGNGYRLYYLASNVGPQMENPNVIRYAASSDGIRFADRGPALEMARLVDPDVFRHKETWFMYVFSGNGTAIATSLDGGQFTFRQILALPGWGTTAPVALGDGRLRLYAFEQRRPAANRVGSFLSEDGVTWTAEPGTRMVASDGEQITDPFVIRWRGGWKMYFKSGPPPQPPKRSGPAGQNPRPAGRGV